MKNVLSAQQFTNKALLSKLFKRAAELQAMKRTKYPKALQDLTIVTIFFEPSTRTRLSFETAIQNLGGHLITVENANDFSSAKKGESLEDTIITLCQYADAIVMRHPEIGAADKAALVSTVPFINAGDGGGEHPTQALLDLYTIQANKQRIDGLKIGLAGDLKNSRTMHSLSQLLAIYDVELILVAPKALRLPDKYRKILKNSKVKFTEVESWDKVLPEVDVLYTNRIQKERFESIKDFLAVKDSFVLTMPHVKTMKKGAIIMNPLPRINEIDVAVDSDPRAIYFQQVRNGLFVRMALLEQLFAA